MRHLVNIRFICLYVGYTFYNPVNKKLGFFRFCPPDMMCVQNTVVGMNNVFHTVFTYSKIRYTCLDPINKKLGFFQFCPPDMMCVQNNGRLF